LSLSGCGGEGKVTTTGQPGEIEVDLSARGAARVVGVRAVLEYQSKQQTRIVVDGLDGGEPTGSAAKARVVRGTCEKPAGPAFALKPIRNGSSETTLGVGVPELLARDYAIQVISTTTKVNVLACGDLPDAAPES
jgi:hypothetical protein